MKYTLISPRIAVQKGDFLGSGVPYWPLELATLASFLRERGEEVHLLDLFGARPSHLEDKGDHYLQGLPLSDLLEQPAVQSADAFLLFAMSYMSHHEVLDMVRTIKRARPSAPIAILENSQAVTSYSLQRVTAAFFEAGAAALICGEPYFNWPDIAASLHGPGAAPPPNVLVPGSCREPSRILEDGHYPVPAWDLVNLENYWSLPYSHGPKKTRRYLPVLTSRGCPYPCDFCIAPETNGRRWRGREAIEVVDEMITLRDRFGVRHFQVEDLNPTVGFRRFKVICELLIERRASIDFYLVSGTKAETIPVAEVPLMARAGCRYLSISPESGSPRLMQVIGKKFDNEHALELVAACHAHGIRTQACFLVGHPAENDDDFIQSHAYLQRLVRSGLDEVAVFIVAPFAGSSLHARSEIAVGDDRALVSFSPKGRANFEVLMRRRRMLVRAFFTEKLRRGASLWAQGWRALVGRPETKMENLPRRIAYVLLLVARSRNRKVKAT